MTSPSQFSIYDFHQETQFFLGVAKSLRRKIRLNGKSSLRRKASKSRSDQASCSTNRPKSICQDGAASLKTTLFHLFSKRSNQASTHSSRENYRRSFESLNSNSMSRRTDPGRQATDTPIEVCKMYIT
jgi:hypothetical protein